MIVTKEFLKSRNVPEGSIQISSEDCINKSKNLTQEKIENIIFPEVLSTLQQEFNSRHETLSHLHLKSIFRLAKIGFLPSRFIDLKNDAPRSECCMFVTAMISLWRKKGSK